MTAFFIAPYEPLTWASTSSDLEIDPDWYKRQLLKNWPNIEFFQPTTKYYVLSWRFPSTAEGSGSLAGLQENLQVISMSAPFEEYIVWHRSIIPDDYTLYLFNESSSNSLELTSKLTIEDIEQFVGRRG
jgi:hypothetical protein